MVKLMNNAIIRAIKFTRAKERIREIKRHYFIEGKVIEFAYRRSFAYRLKAMWTQDGNGGVRNLSFSEIRDLLTREVI